MILEGVVTTLDEDDAVHVAPMGPFIEDGYRRLVLRPFETSHTYHNLVRAGEGVFHVTDDVDLIARAAVGRMKGVPETKPAPIVRGRILTDACRWYAFRVQKVDQRESRAVMSCLVVASGQLREFFGFNRAKHAVLEAAILATRIHLVPRDALRAELGRLAPLVEKTGSSMEQKAFAFLEQYVEEGAHDGGL